MTAPASRMLLLRSSRLWRRQSIERKITRHAAVIVVANNRTTSAPLSTLAVTSGDSGGRASNGTAAAAAGVAAAAALALGASYSSFANNTDRRTTSSVEEASPSSFSPSCVGQRQDGHGATWTPTTARKDGGTPKIGDTTDDSAWLPSKNREHSKTTIIATSAASTDDSNITTTTGSTTTNNRAKHPRPVVFCGPSGVGKNTLITLLRLRFPDETFGFSVSHTTRQPRGNEVDGVDYHFTTVENMKRDIDAGKFVEYAEVHGNYYGTSIESIQSVQQSGKICILDIDVQGVRNVKDNPSIDPIYIFIAPPSMDELEYRLRGRATESESDIVKRLANATAELDYGLVPGNFDRVFENDDLEDTLEAIFGAFKGWYPQLDPSAGGGGASKRAPVADDEPASADCSNQDQDDKEEEEEEEEEEDSDDDTHLILNWSGTHSVRVPSANFHEPETLDELHDIVSSCHDSGTPLRPVGAALSPNGIAFHSKGMISLSNLDRIVNVDKTNMTVTVQAGARVSQVIDELRSHGLTLPNLASIAEQQIGGFVQVGAHGTGARIPPVDEFVTEMTMVTPAKGVLKLSEELNPDLFRLAKVGLGCLGVVTEVTMKVIPAHNLVERTYVLTRSEAKKQFKTLLRRHKHVRYMWIPYADAVVVVTNNPEGQVPGGGPTIHDMERKYSDEERFQPLTDLLEELTVDAKEPFTKENMKGMGFGELRDALLAIVPLDVDHVKRCNEAEAEFWRRSEGYQIQPSDRLLQFDCGGQQWVREVCFPAGTYGIPSESSIAFMERLLSNIEGRGLPAPAPIEQRWSSSSRSALSPSHGTDPDGLHSWIGIIMYLPSDDVRQRKDITDKFNGEYCATLHTVGREFHAAVHWAKLEPPRTAEEAKDLSDRIRAKYGHDVVEAFNAARAEYDPKNILSNPLVDFAFGVPTPSP